RRTSARGTRALPATDPGQRATRWRGSVAAAIRESPSEAIDPQEPGGRSEVLGGAAQPPGADRVPLTRRALGEVTHRHLEAAVAVRERAERVLTLSPGAVDGRRGPRGLPVGAEAAEQLPVGERPRVQARERADHEDGQEQEDEWAGEAGCSRARHA